MSQIILVRGSGDVGSAVAHTLFEAGYGVVIHDSTKPSATRRKMSFCDAIYDGYAELSGIPGRLVCDISDLTAQLPAHDSIPVTTLDFPDILAILQPAVLVDARMRKHDQPEVQIKLAPFTIGLGPNFTAGTWKGCLEWGNAAA
jgi:xanthine dehydrogenase accessory factor